MTIASAANAAAAGWIMAATTANAETIMTASLEIRTNETGDLPAIETLYADAFPTEDLLPLARDLLRQPAITMSLVALAHRSVVGHVMFTRCSVQDSGCKTALLGPLAVAQA